MLFNLVFCKQVAKILAVSFILLLLIACSSVAVNTNNPLKAGEQLFSDGDTTGALLAWQQTPASSAEDIFDVELKKSRAFRELGLNKKALQSAQLALAQLTSSADTKKHLLVELELGLTELALSELNSARTRLEKIQAQAQQLTLWSEAAQIEMGLALLDKLEGLTDNALNHYSTAAVFAQRGHDEWILINVRLLQLPLLAEQKSASVSELWSQTATQIHTLPPSKRQTMALIRLVRIAQTHAFLPTSDSRLLDFLQEAEKSSLVLKDDRLLSYALGYQGTIFEQQGDNTKALELTNKAATAAQHSLAIESLYLWEWQAGRLHQQQHQDELALAAFQRAVDNLQQIRDSKATEQSFTQQIRPLYTGLADLLLKKASAEHDNTQKQQLLDRARKTLEKLKTAELQDYFQDRCVARFIEKSQSMAQALPQTAVIYPILLPDRTEIIVGFDDGLKQFVVPVGNERMNQEIQEFRHNLEKRSSFHYLKAAKQLYSWLLAPLQADLEAHHVDTLVIVPDGALRSIPFAALHDGQHYAIERYAFATTPSLSLTEPQKPSYEAMAMLINGLTESVQGFSALPNVELELSTIHSQFDSILLENEAFKTESLRAAMAENPYKIVHIASHGQFDHDPKKTFLLTYDGKATMDILESLLSNNKYQHKPVELLTLSACQTAAGDDRAALGMAGVAIKSGVRSALASLWFINDQSSSQLVTYFYQYLKDHKSKAQALRLAQLQLRKELRYRHATYWASFLLIGNWL